MRPRCGAVFSRALADNSAERFPTALEFAEALSYAFPSAAVALPPPPIAPAVPPPALIAQGSEPRLPLDDPEPRNRPEVELRDLDLRAAEEARYDDVAVAPAIVDVEVSEPITAQEEEHDREVAVPAELIERRVPPGPPEPPSRVWPLVAMLIFGVVAGLAAGYVVWSRPNPVAPQEAVVGTPSPPRRQDHRDGNSQRARSRRRGRTRRRTDVLADRSDVLAEYPIVRGGCWIRSTPSGATVFLDGKEQGTTPVAVREIDYGAHRIRLEHDGYAPVERSIVISASQPAQSIIVPLAEARATASGGTRSSTPVPATPATLGHYSGTLIIESKPPGAKVYVDNKLTGTTPLSVQNVPAGSHAVRLERDGYRRWSSSGTRGGRRTESSDGFAGEMMDAILALEDGTWFQGQAAGAEGEARGEVVFNTSMTGYQEVLTDPSYAGQIVTMTCPEIGNYGVSPEDVESRAPHVAGFIIRDESPISSNWRAESTLREYLVANKIVAISDIDTRALTRRLRSAGVMRGVVVTGNALDPAELVERAKAIPQMEGSDLVRGVTTAAAFDWPEEDPGEFDRCRRGARTRA